MKRSSPSRTAHEASHVYVMATIGHPPYVKVGISKRPNRRMASVARGGPHSLHLVEAWNVGQGTARCIEAEAHQILAPYHVRGEWFSCSAKAAAFVCREIIGGKIDANFIDALIGGKMSYAEMKQKWPDAFARAGAANVVIEL